MYRVVVTIEVDYEPKDAEDRILHERALESLGNALRHEASRIAGLRVFGNSTVDSAVERVECNRPDSERPMSREERTAWMRTRRLLKE